MRQRVDPPVRNDLYHVMILLRPSSTFNMSDVPYPKSVLSDEVLADRLGLTTREFRRYCKQNLIRLSSAAAVGESEGLMVTCQFGNRVWEGHVVNGCITFEEVRFLRGKRATNRH
ncbi:hypothetical protein GFL54_31240 [Rhizobium laguerreae]|uniref:Uncharacterized protein n=1 Tax=Rhizobium laguerreae TaxID=1076926 RepID=A0ABR6GIL1_9HYPH|nr:hypothetical protein [Rhizobium laguerreae]NKM88648.1 hypothetical protein [Rhizobium laguerreae]OOO52541.1 hypothetical protein BS630_04175 [Rhizobium laguerreae]